MIIVVRRGFFFQFFVFIVPGVAVVAVLVFVGVVLFTTVRGLEVVLAALLLGSIFVAIAVVQYTPPCLRPQQ